MTDLELKKELIQRIIQYEPVSDGLINTLLQKPLSELEETLSRLVEKAAADAVQAHQDEARRASQFDSAYVHALRNVTLNGKRLVDCDSNRVGLENSLQPHEDASGSLYATISLTYPAKFSWETPKVKPTQEDQRKAFDAFVRERGLSSCEANFNLFRDGASEGHFAGASGIERAAYQAQQAQERQHFLIHNASPTQLKQESAWESQQNRVQAQSEEATRSHQYVLSQQGHYPPLPATMPDTNEVIDSKFIRKLSTINYPLFRAWVKKYGVGNLNSRLRGEN